tara:strand:+ start:42 stop:560 length:519 start_codon:yes stop_codon:yes gene_type:complete
MAFVAHGLKCNSCGEKDSHVFYRKSNGPPPCPSCGGARSIDWTHGKFPGVSGDGIGSFTPVDMGVLGYCETREDYNRAVGVIKERFPGHRVEIESETQTQKDTRLDERMHKQWVDRKSRNIDSTLMKEVKEKSTAYKKEARSKAVAQNANPNKAKVAKRVGSAGKNAGSWGQ